MKKGFIYIILAGVLWGTTGLFVHYLSPYGFTSVQLTCARIGVSFLCLLVYALIADKDIFRARWLHILLSCLVGACTFLSSYFYFSSIQQTSTSTAVMLLYTAPIYVMIFSVFFFGEGLTSLKLVAVGLMLMGCCFVSGVIGGLKFDLMGIIMGVLSGIAYAAYSILTKICMRKGANPLSVSFYSALSAFVLALCFSKPLGIITCTAKEPLIILPLLLGLGVATYVLPYLFTTLSLKQLPAGTVSALSVIEPMSATIFGMIAFGEIPDLLSAFGIILTLASVLLFGLAEGGKSRKQDKHK